ncbi:rhodanese-like domain-containing protein [Desulfatiferula olefinivorans]
MLTARSMAFEIGLILLLAVLTGFGVNALSPRGIALVGQWDVDKGVVTAAAKNGPVVHDLEIRRVREAYDLFRSAGALFVDARDESVYREGHIRGAVSLFPYDYDRLFGDFTARYPDRDRLIVTYCSGRECEDSHMLAQYLIEDGYTRVRVFIDGYPAWVAEGFPIDVTD